MARQEVGLLIDVDQEKEWRDKAVHQEELCKEAGQRKTHNIAEWMAWAERR